MVISAAQVTLLFLSWLRKEGSLFIRFVFKPRRWDFRCCFPWICFDGDWMTVFYYTSRKKAADWICWAVFFFTFNAMDSSPFWWRFWELSTNLGILLYVYIYIHTWPSIAAEFVGIHDLNPGLSLKNWGFCPPPQCNPPYDQALWTTGVP